MSTRLFSCESPYDRSKNPALIFFKSTGSVKYIYGIYDIMLAKSSIVIICVYNISIISDL